MKLNLSYFEVHFVANLFLVDAFRQNSPWKIMEREFGEINLHTAFHNKISN